MRIAVALALTLLLATLAWTATQAGTRPAGGDTAPATDRLLELSGKARTICQGGELLPKGTSAIRVSLATPEPGPAVALRAARDGSAVTSGTRPAGWSGGAVTIPVRSVTQATAGVRVCISVAAGPAVTLLGRAAKHAAPIAGERRPGRFRIDFLRSGRETWASYAATVAHRLGLQSIWGGGWIALVAIALMAATSAGVAVALIRAPQEPPLVDTRAPVAASREGPWGRLRHVPAAAWICALVGFLNAATWSIVSPPFQVPDEQDHLAYVQLLAETGRAPTFPGTSYSPEEDVTLRGLNFAAVRAQQGRPIWSTVQRRRLDRALDARPSRRDRRRAAGVATFQPPLYYAVAAGTARLVPGGTLLHRMVVLRLLSALLAGLTALFVFLFVREALPGAPWAWTIGGLGFAVQPMVGFSSGAVNPDALLFAISAALFYCVARGFRRGLTARLSVVAGLLLAAGFLTKFTFAGLIPGGLLALVVIALRQAPGARRAALRLPAIAIGVALVSICLVALVNTIGWSRPAFGTASTAPGVIKLTSGSAKGSLGQELVYIWQLFLPRLPGMPVDFPGLLPLRDYWWHGFVGLFGWAKIPHPDWVYRAALLPAIMCLEPLGHTLVGERRALRRRSAELAVYAAMAAGTLALIGVASYTLFLTDQGGFFQSRYLLPLGAPFAAVLALTARGGGPRWGPVLGTAIVMLILGLDIHSQLLVVAAFFG